MGNQDEEKISYPKDGEIRIPSKWMKAIQTGDFNIIETPGNWAITSIEGENIISFNSEDEMNIWKMSLIVCRDKVRTKNLPNLGSNKRKKTKKKSKAVVRKDFVITEAFKRMKSDPDHWREQK